MYIYHFNINLQFSAFFVCFYILCIILFFRRIDFGVCFQRAWTRRRGCKTKQKRSATLYFTLWNVQWFLWSNPQTSIPTFSSWSPTKLKPLVFISLLQYHFDNRYFLPSNDIIDRHTCIKFIHILGKMHLCDCKYWGLYKNDISEVPNSIIINYTKLNRSK